MFNVVEKNILELNTALNNNLITSYELVLIYLNRISLIDNGETAYNSILEINPDALNIAKAMDFERKAGKIRSKMHGIPVILKDNINTNDLMHTTAGSLALKDNYANYDATLVKNLRESGAIILGKANLTEFANFMAYDMKNGYSSLGKEVLCPYNIEEDPSGSSAGSAVSVTLNLTPVAVGTETGGSIMSPSIKNGVVGLKPTIGLISRHGIVPISSTLDTAGPIGKNVTDVAVLLSVLRSNDKKDPVTNQKVNKKIDYTKYLDIDGLKGARIGIDKTRYKELSSEKQKAFNENIKLMEKNGATIIDNLNIKQTDYIFNVMKYEFKRSLNKYLSTLGTNSKMKTLKDIIDYNRHHSKECLVYGQQLLEFCEYDTSGKMNEPEYYHGLYEKEEAILSLNKTFKEHNLDIIYFASYTSLGPHCGYPTMTIPCGIDKSNIPIGTYFLAPMNQESKLISVGYAFEQLTKKRINPLKE